MIDIAVLRALAAQGATVEMIIAAVEAAQKSEVEHAEIEKHQKAEKLAERRERDRIRKRNQRSRPQRPTGISVTSADSCDKESVSPIPPSKEKPPSKENGSLRGDPQKKDLPPGKPEAEIAFNAWNEVAKKLALPVARMLTAERIRNIKARLKEHGLQGWHDALAQIEHSPHLLGENDRGWRANLEFLCRPSKFNVVLEGGYRRGGRGPPKDAMTAALDGLDDFVRNHGDEQEFDDDSDPTLDLQPVDGGWR